MKEKKEEDKDYIKYCFKYYTCKLCPKNEQCKKEEENKVKTLKKKR